MGFCNERDLQTELDYFYISLYGMNTGLMFYSWRCFDNFIFIKKKNVWSPRY